MVDWRTEGVRIVKSGELDFNTAQTPGMTRAAAINHAKAGAQKLWAGHGERGAERQDRRASPRAPGKHHLRGEGPGADALGRAAGVHRRGRSGDFIFVPPYVPHQEINALPGDPLRMRGGPERPGGGGGEPRHRPAEEVEEVRWVDPNHPEGSA